MVHQVRRALACAWWQVVLMSAVPQLCMAEKLSQGALTSH